jgi:hypothetical protein
MPNERTITAAHRRAKRLAPMHVPASRGRTGAPYQRCNASESVSEGPAIVILQRNTSG